MINFVKEYQKVQWVVFALALLIYANTIPNKWALDDGISIHKNNFVKRGISGIPDILSKEAFTGFYGQDMNLVAGGRYRPLSPVVFAMQAEVLASAQKDANEQAALDKAGFRIKDLSEETLFPHILHVFNALWYGLLCLLLYRTLLLLFRAKQASNSGKAEFLALVSALIYTVHPLHTEAVANVKGLDEILAMLGSVATLYFVIRHYLQQRSEDTQRPPQQFMPWALVCYTLALFAKENAVTFMAVIPMALWFFTDANPKSIIKLTAPLLLPLLLFLGARSAVLHQPNKGEVAEELMNDPFLVLDPTAQYTPLMPNSDIKRLTNPNANTFVKMPYSNQLATNFYTWGKYLQLLAIPYPLTVDYYPRHIAIKSFTDIGVLFSVILHVCLLGWALYHIRKKKIVAFGILYYLITFSPVSNLLFPIGTNMAERFMFMPSLGFCIIVASGLYDFGKKWSGKKEVIQVKTIYLGVGALVCVYAVLTFKRNFDWKDDLTLFSKDITVSVNSGKITTDLASQLINKAIRIRAEKEAEIEGLSAVQKKAVMQETEAEQAELVKQALPLLKKSLAIHPMSNEAWFQIANAHLFLGGIESQTPDENLNHLNTALLAYEQAYKYRPAGRDTVIVKLTALCYTGLGKIVGEKFGDINASIQLLQKATTLDSLNAETFMILGTAYSMKPDFVKSIAYTKKSLALRPNDRDTRKNLATAWQRYAFADATQKSGLLLAEKLLLEVLTEEKKLPDNNVLKRDALLKTLDLLVRNYTIQGKPDKVREYQNELLKVKASTYE